MPKGKGAPDAPGMKGKRSRTEKGPLRKKREDTEIGKIEETYGIDTGFRSDAHLGTVEDYFGVDNVKDLVDTVRKKGGK
jgi:hypothetical protein